MELYPSVIELKPPPFTPAPRFMDLDLDLLWLVFCRLSMVRLFWVLIVVFSAKRLAPLIVVSFRELILRLPLLAVSVVLV